MNITISLKQWKIITVIGTIAGVIGGALVSPYLIAITLGISTIALTIIELQEDWLLAIVDLIFSSLLFVGGAKVGVFGLVVSLGIAFGTSLFLPNVIRKHLPVLSIVEWKAGRITKTQKFWCIFGAIASIFVLLGLISVF